MAKKTTEKKIVSTDELKKELDTLKSQLLLLTDPKLNILTVSPSVGSNSVKVLRIDDILYISTEPNRLKVVTVDGSEYFNFESLAGLDKKYKGHPYFIRVHKSHYANLDRVAEIAMSESGRDLFYTIGKNQHKVPVSYTYLKKVKDYFDF